MATAQHGSLTGVLVNGYDLSPFLNMVNETETLDLADATCFGPLGTPVDEKEYVAGLGDATLDASGKYTIDKTGLNQDQVAEVLEAAIRAANKPVVDILRWGDGFGNSVHGYLADVTEYGPAASISSIVSVMAKFQASAAIDAMQVVHTLTEQASPGTNGTDLDAGASYDAAKWKGVAAHLHVTAVSGATPSLTAKVQHSTDGTTWVDLVTFDAVTVKHKAQRKIVLGTVNRHLRALWTISTGATVTFHLSAGRIPA